MVGISVRLSPTFVATAMSLGGPMVVSVADADTGTSLELSLDGVLSGRFEVRSGRWLFLIDAMIADLGRE